MNAGHRYVGGNARRGKYCSLMQKPVFRQAVIPSPSVRTAAPLEMTSQVNGWKLAPETSGMWLIRIRPKPFGSFTSTAISMMDLAGTSPSFFSLLDSTPRSRRH